MKKMHCILFLFIQVLHAAGLEDCAFKQIVEATERSLQERKQVVPEPIEWKVEENGLSFSIHDGFVKLNGTKDQIAIKEALTDEQARFLKQYTERNALGFDKTLSKGSNEESLKKGIQYAKLHAAFYGRGARPIDAANELKALVKRGVSNNPHMTVTFTEAPTMEERMKGISNMTEALTELSKLHDRGRLERAVGELKQENERDAGRRLISQILGEKPELTLEDVLDATEAAQRRRDPKAVEITFDYKRSHEERTIHIERAPNGRLRINTNAPVGTKFNSLKSLVEWAQGTGYSGKDQDWRTYETTDAISFEP